MAANSSLRTRIVLWLGGYTLLLSLAVLVNGYVINEHAEQVVWHSLMESELDHFIERRQADPDYEWRDTHDLKLYGAGYGDAVPSALARLEPGMYDEVKIDGREWIALVQDSKGRRLVLTLDITAFEAREMKLALWMFLGTAVVVILLGLLMAWGVGRVVRPLTDLARGIGQLQPDHTGQRVTSPERASSELVVIADALNDYLQRNERFVERERAFIDITSHELRTPIAVIAGASELALDQPGLPASARNQMLRVQRTSRGVEQLISLLLVLAKDPDRLAGISDRFSLGQLLPKIVEDHRYLSRDKDLALALGPMPECQIVAPEIIVRAAIGNLLRNAIENSDRGEIRISLQADATVVIEDPGHGMSPEEISEIYARLARGGGRDGGGIGLDLISRLCEHLGWRLAFSSVPGRGTRTTLHLGQG
ncbi:MAG: sensor histidine kinase [Pseudoxanthomonas sp.]